MLDINTLAADPQVLLHNLTMMFIAQAARNCYNYALHLPAAKALLTCGASCWMCQGCPGCALKMLREALLLLPVALGVWLLVLVGVNGAGGGSKLSFR
jgi:hypothetical protein